LAITSLGLKGGSGFSIEDIESWRGNACMVEIDKIRFGPLLTIPFKIIKGFAKIQFKKESLLILGS
jgi:hypothetical protein